MGKSLEDRLNELPPERRAKIEARSDELAKLTKISQCLGMYDLPGEEVTEDVKVSRDEYLKEIGW